MKVSDPALLLRTAPFLRRNLTTPALMRDVIYALVPVIGASIWFFGVSAILVIVAATAGAMLTEWRFTPEGKGGAALADGSALLTGLLLALTLPPGIPLWMAFLGGVIGIGLGKLVWGGLGHNLFNPALVGRAFLQAAFPTVLTTWALHGGPSDFLAVRGANLAFPLLQGGVDAVTTATPLSMMKFDHNAVPAAALFLGNTAGSLGETSGVLILLSGIYLTVRRMFDWRIPAGVLLAAAIFSGILFLVAPDRYPTPLFTILSGGLLFGTVFMATDPVTSPLSPRGAWIFGAGIGFLVVLIRVFGGLPEGVMYAILLMNGATPLIERAVQPRPFGRGKHR